MTEHPCHIEAPHGSHEWMPLVADPEHARVLHVGLATLTCPGKVSGTREEVST